MKSLTLLATLAPFTLGACATLFGPGSPFAFDKKGDLVEFNFAWSAEASRNGRLVRVLRGELEREFAATTAAAEADRAASKVADRPFKGHRYSRRYTTAGQSPRLLSLEARTAAVAGGPVQYESKALLWDRRAARPVNFSALISSTPAFSEAVRPAFCRALDAEPDRRGASAGACPQLDQLTIVPADRDSDGRFDTLRMIADPALAGPKADDYTVIDLPVTARVLAVLSPTYRAGFEAR